MDFKKHDLKHHKNKSDKMLQNVVCNQTWSQSKFQGPGSAKTLGIHHVQGNEDAKPRDVHNFRWNEDANT